MATTAAAASGQGHRPVVCKRENGRVWLEGVEGFSFGEMQSSTLGTQAEVLRALGEPLTYEELAGGSGLAFRVQMYKANMCPSAPHAMVGYQCVSDAFRPIGLKLYDFNGLKPENPEAAKKIREGRDAVKASIDAGVPAIAVSEEDGLIVGYQKEGLEWLMVNPMRDGGHKVYVEAGLPWCVVVADGRQKSVLSPRETALAAMKQAVAMWGADTERYYVGEKAWQAWIDRIGSMVEHPERAKDDQMGNAWMYDSLVANRRIAASYLRKLAGQFKAATAEHMHRAADLYERAATQVLCESGRGVEAIAPYPAAGWSQAQRDDQVRRMREAMTLDRQAVDELRLAIGAVGE